MIIILIIRIIAGNNQYFNNLRDSFRLRDYYLSKGIRIIESLIIIRIIISLHRESNNREYDNNNCEA